VKASSPENATKRRRARLPDMTWRTIGELRAKARRLLK
jgi:hypothetical protein